MELSYYFFPPAKVRKKIEISKLLREKFCGYLFGVLPSVILRVPTQAKRPPYPVPCKKKI